MNDNYVFLNSFLVFAFLVLIFSIVFFGGAVDIRTTVIILFLLSCLAYFFFYKGNLFQKLLFVSSVGFLLGFTTFFGDLFFNNYSTYVLVLNWFFIWLISKKSSNMDKITAKNQILSIVFVLYLIFSLILILSHDIYNTILGAPLEIILCIPVIVSLILSIFFMITTLDELSRIMDNV